MSGPNWSAACAHVALEIEMGFARSSTYVRVYGERTAVYLSRDGTVKLMASSISGADIDTDLTDAGLLDFLKGLADDGFNVENPYLGVNWSFEYNDNPCFLL